MGYKTTIFENLKSIENTIYKKGIKYLFYDISELGWSRYISAHLNYLHKNNIETYICCSEDRKTLYRGISNFLPIPEEYYEKFNGFLSASHHLHNPIKGIDIIDTNILSEPFKNKYPEYHIIQNYSKFEGERIFEPYNHDIKNEEYVKKFKNCIIVLPRYRESRFARRNISKESWIKIITELCINYTDMDIISIGGKNETLSIDLNFKNYHNLVNVKNNLDILVSFCNLNIAKLVIGTQSGLMHIATMCKTTSFIIGHDPYDMGIYTENFTKSKIIFHQTVESKYGYVINIDDLINKIIRFMYIIKMKFEL
jgi:ADP-heptose:LPS heptosyltransferase